MDTLPLRDIHLPAPVGGWPLAMGWWLLIAFTLFLALLIFYGIRRIMRTTLKKEARQTLESIQRHYLERGDAKACVTDLSILLRRMAISRKLPGGVIGEEWLKQLDAELGTREFSEGVGRLLITAPYRKTVENEPLEPLFRLCHKWVEAL